jgi:hypothetical protein
MDKAVGLFFNHKCLLVSTSVDRLPLIERGKYSMTCVNMINNLFLESIMGKSTLPTSRG